MWLVVGRIVAVMAAFRESAFSVPGLVDFGGDGCAWFGDVLAGLKMQVRPGAGAGFPVRVPVGDLTNTELIDE